MGKLYDKIEPHIKDWVAQQKIFFVSTAPLSQEGHINCSPKGHDSFVILDDHTVAYLDLTGSGVETIAHLQENKRIVIMFCAFEGPPKIVRFHGQGQVISPQDSEFPQLLENFPSYEGIRSIIKVQVTRISDSCGYSIPNYKYEGERDVLHKWTEKKGPEGILDYQKERNAQSIDQLTGVHWLESTNNSSD